MEPTSVIDAARRALGTVGVFLPVPTTSAPPADLQRAAVRRLEHAGYRAAWANEGIGGKDALTQLAVLLAATERLVFGTGVANIWARQPQTAHAASALLAQAYAGRFVLGLGVGYPEQAASVGQEFGSPLATMRDYLRRMTAPPQFPVPDVAYPRIVAANGPRMVALAGELADGAMPAMKPPEFTAQARQLLGLDKLLVVLVRTTVGEGGGAIAAVREHRAAGADHVALVMPTGTEYTAGVDYLEQLAPSLVELT